MMAVTRRRPKTRVIIYSDQGSQFGSDVFTLWCQAHQLEASMSRRGNCHDNAVADSFYSSLKKRAHQAADLCNTCRGTIACVRLH